jgi:hypothetical protein
MQRRSVQQRLRQQQEGLQEMALGFRACREKEEGDEGCKAVVAAE